MHLPDAKECIKGSRQHHGMSNTTPGLIVSVDQDVPTGRLAGAAATFFSGGCAHHVYLLSIRYLYSAPAASCGPARLARLWNQAEEGKV